MRITSVTKYFWLVLLTVILVACGGQTPSATQPAELASPEPAVTGEVSFSADVLPLFEARCTHCHGTSRQNGGLMLNSYAALTAGGAHGAVVIPGDAASSLLVKLITQGEMPRNSSPLSSEQITLISNWINAGALDN